MKENQLLTLRSSKQTERGKELGSSVKQDLGIGRTSIIYFSGQHFLGSFSISYLHVNTVFELERKYCHMHTLSISLTKGKLCRELRSIYLSTEAPHAEFSSCSLPAVLKRRNISWNETADCTVCATSEEQGYTSRAEICSPTRANSNRVLEICWNCCSRDFNQHIKNRLCAGFMTQGKDKNTYVPVTNLPGHKYSRTMFSSFLIKDLGKKEEKKKKEKKKRCLSEQIPKQKSYSIYHRIKLQQDFFKSSFIQLLQGIKVFRYLMSLVSDDTHTTKGFLNHWQIPPYATLGRPIWRKAPVEWRDCIMHTSLISC